MNSPATSLRSEAVGPLETLAFLKEIPSETSLAERQLLFNYFRNRWDGSSTVVEIGPFLGGTTRAIALGMSRNPRLAAGAVLHTFDRFDAYYSPEQLRQTIEPMVKGEIFAAFQADELCRSADFEQLFDAIHRSHAYARLVQLHNSPLPDLPAEIATSRALSCLDDAGELGAVFVDGCKSWASTQYAMKYLLPRARQNAPVIFQDFGWYTCFWISSFAYALRDFLEFESRADSTYLFRLIKPVSAEEISSRFGPTPDSMGLKFFQEAGKFLLEESLLTGDLRGELIAQLHQVAALITLGRRDAASAILKAIEVRRYAAFADMMKGCVKSPTYRPGGKPIVWNTST